MAPKTPPKFVNTITPFNQPPEWHGVDSITPKTFAPPGLAGHPFFANIFIKDDDADDCHICFWVTTIALGICCLLYIVFCMILVWESSKVNPGVSG